MPFLLSLTAISHILYCCASVVSHERSGGPRTGRRPHSFAKWYSDTPITTNESAPVQWTGHTGLLVHLRSINPCRFDSPRPITLQEAVGIRILQKLSTTGVYVCKERKAAEWEKALLCGLGSWTTPRSGYLRAPSNSQGIRKPSRAKSNGQIAPVLLFYLYLLPFNL